jgi:hypothetical protein
LAAAFALLLLVGFALLMLWARLAAVLVGLCVAVLGEWAVLTPGSCDMLTRTEKVWVLQLVVSFRPPRACAPPLQGWMVRMIFANLGLHFMSYSST